MDKPVKYYFYFGIICLIVFLFISQQKTYSDELPHSEQIKKFVNGNYSLVYYLTTIPGYEAIIASVVRVFKLVNFDISDILNVSRFVSLMILFFGLIPVFYNLSKKNIMRTSQFVLFSPIFTFLFLVYTDLMSMMFILIGYYYIKNKSYRLSGIVFGLSLLIRQNNIVWLGFAMIYIFYTQKIKFIRFLYPKTLFKFFLRIYWVYFIAIICFGIFVILNKGMVLGTDKPAHVAGLYVGNIWWLGFLMFFTQLPLMLGRFYEVLKKFSSFSFTLFLFGISCIFLALFTNAHIYNTYPGFIRNIILHWVFLNPSNMIISLVPMFYFIAYVAADKLKNKQNYIFWIFSIIVLIPPQLIDTRYCLVPIAFWMLNRNEQEKPIEIMQLCYSILISIVFLWGILNWKVFW
jgi:hypothetical protein